MAESRHLRLLFMGTPEFACASLRKLVESQSKWNAKVVGAISQPDRPSGRGQKVLPTPVRSEALALGVEHHQTERLSLPTTMDWIRARRPDLVVVVAFGQLLKQELLDLPTYGCINVHASLLPRWRGASPIAAAVLAGDRVTGVSIQKVVLALDAGPILHHHSLPILPDDTQATLFGKLSVLGANTLEETLDRFVKADCVWPETQPQDASGVTFAPKMAGPWLLDVPWLGGDLSVVEMDRRIRGLHPWPAAKIQTPHGRVKILRATPERGTSAVAGQVFEAQGGLYLGGSDGRLRIHELQLDGKRPLNAGDFLNGLKNQTEKALPWTIETPHRTVGPVG